MQELVEVSGPVVTGGVGEELGELSVSMLGVAGLHGGYSLVLSLVSAVCVVGWLCFIMFILYNKNHWWG